MSTASPMSATASPGADWRDFFALTKPRVMTLVIFTGLCGLLAAPGSLDPVLGFTAILCIAVGAGGAAALNQWPVPAGRMAPVAARDFGFALSGGSVLVMLLAIGWLAAVILAFSIFYYAWIYTVWLKPRTPQNIVIGGGAGAFPPLIGWVAVTGHITLMPVLLFLIIFAWTPPHFWALALFVQTDYAKVGIPMMPVVAGERSTRHQILAYAVVLLVVTLLPSLLGYTGLVYGLSALVLGAVFVWLSAKVALRRPLPEGDTMKPEKRLFGWSILYLFILFAMLVVDRLVPIHGA